jgi:hypothetical protein
MPSDDDFINLQHQVDGHEGDLDQLSKRIKTLEEDLALILSLPGPIANQILANASQVGNSAYDQMRVQKCTALVKRYDMGFRG